MAQTGLNDIFAGVHAMLILPITSAQKSLE